MQISAVLLIFCLVKSLLCPYPWNLAVKSAVCQVVCHLMLIYLSFFNRILRSLPQRSPAELLQFVRFTMTNRVVISERIVVNRVEKCLRLYDPPGEMQYLWTTKWKGPLSQKVTVINHGAMSQIVSPPGEMHYIWTTIWKKSSILWWSNSRHLAY